MKCTKCYGHGFWPIGPLCPIGPMDAGGWADKVVKCPWCKAGTAMKNERYKILKKIKDGEK